MTIVRSKIKLPGKSTDVATLYYVMISRNFPLQEVPKFYFDGSFLAIY